MSFTILSATFYEYKSFFPKFGLERALCVVCLIILTHAILGIGFSQFMRLWNYKELLYLAGLWKEEIIVIPPKL